MKNLKKKLFITACVVGMIGLGYISPVKAFESKIPIDSPVVKTESRESMFEVDYHGITMDVKGVTTYKTLENGVKLTEIDFGPDGKTDYITLEQSLPDGRAIVEVDKDADGNIDYRGTFNNDGSLLIEKQLPDGFVEKELIKLKKY